MSQEKNEKNIKNPEKLQEIDFDDLEKVTGGSAFDTIPRVPEKPIDDNLKSKI